MSLWEGNLQVLRERLPEAAERVRTAASGGKAVSASEADGRILAARWLTGRRVRKGALLAVSGFGDGRHVRELLRVLPPGALVFVGEAEPADLRAALEAIDVRDVLGDPRVMLGTGVIDDAFFRPLEGGCTIEMTDIEACLYAPCFNRASDYYARFFTEFVRFAEFRRKLEGTRIADAALWQGNTISNLAVLAPAPDIAAMAGLFRGRPMVLVSAGPSLDESLEFVRAASRVAVVVAVNSSYRALRNAGIVPPLVLAADPRESTLRGFAGIRVDGTWLVTTPIVHPEVVRLFGGRIFIWSGGNELFTEIRRRCGLPPGSRIVEQGTVSACAVDLAAIGGCDRICLVGQDLAIRDDGRSHASDSFYTDMNANRVDIAGCRRLPGNTLPTVLVEEKLHVYLKTFEQLVLYRPQLRFLNTSRLGARIAGVPYAAFGEAAAWLGNKAVGDVPAALRKRHDGGGAHALDLAKVRAALAATRDYAYRVLGSALACAGRCEAVPDALADEAHRDAPEVAAALEARNALEAVLRADTSNFAVLESGRTRVELFRYREFEKRIPEECPPHWAKLLAAREYAWAMAEGAWFLVCRLDGFFETVAQNEGKAGGNPLGDQGTKSTAAP